jgi:hypothetical protein
VNQKEDKLAKRLPSGTGRASDSHIHVPAAAVDTASALDHKQKVWRD